MKIVSITMVNNESEIIESFIRYNYNFLDEMIIIDNGSTDSTNLIINNLKKEGYKITVFDESLEAYNQFELDNKYINKIISERKPDIIIPLDADEFLASDKNVREELECLDLNKIYYVYWKWFVINGDEDKNEGFIPKKLSYCFKEPPFGHTTGSKVTKCIIPANYYKAKKLKLSMGHHYVFGNSDVVIENLDNIFLAHYRIISDSQVRYKTMCYTIRDISTMNNNIETAQRTNQMHVIETEDNISKMAKDISYSGYDIEVIKEPINLEYCSDDTAIMKYSDYALEDLSQRLLNVGREMSIRAYNLEKSKKGDFFVKPVLFWFNNVKGFEYDVPNPSIKLTLLGEFYNVRGFLTDNNKIKFLKMNYKLIVDAKFSKFLPHQFIVVPSKDFDGVKNYLISQGIEEGKIISLDKYVKKMGLFNIVCAIKFFPNLIVRVYKYIGRNGFKSTIAKLKNRI